MVWWDEENIAKIHIKKHLCHTLGSQSCSISAPFTCNISQLNVLVRIIHFNNERASPAPWRALPWRPSPTAGNNRSMLM